MGEPSVVRLTAKNFRGIREASVPLAGTNLLLVGENGSGKSSFVDMFDYVLTGGLARLKRQDVKEQESIPFVKRSSGEPVALEITLEAGGAHQSIYAEFPYQALKVPPAIADWFERNRAHPPILRRAQILNFVEAKGADRYRQISTIIGLDDVDDVLDAWQKLENEAKKARQLKEASQREAEQTLQQLGCSGVPSTVLEAVNTRLAEAGLASIAAMQELSQRRATLAARADVTSASEEATRLLTYAQALDAIATDAAKLTSSYESFHASWGAFVRHKEQWKEALFRELLVHGQKILEARSDITTCPLCQATIDRAATLQALQERIRELDSIHKKKDELEEQRSLVAESAAGLTKQVDTARRSGYAPRVPPLTTLAGGLQELVENLRPDVLSGAYLSPQTLRTTGCMAIVPTIRDHAEHFRGEAQKLQPPVLERKRAEAADWLARVDQAWPAHESARQMKHGAARVYDQISLMCQVLIRARERRLAAIHKDIEGTINAYYQKLHPDEGYGDITLPMERKGQGVGLRTTFHGVDASHPSGCYSEGHLDCVGIAVFLAFIRRANPGGLLILDDVMTTIDSAHRQRLATLLAQEFGDRQMILTTHDRLWAVQLLTTMRAYGLKCTTLHLRPWRHEQGVDWAEFLEERWSEYRQRAATNPQSAVGDAGRDLERILCRMRYGLLLSVPAREDDQYTIGDLYEVFFAWFRKRSVARPDVSFDDELARVNRDLDAYWRLRNWAGAHYNVWGEHLAPAEASDFIALVERLHQLLQCPRCHSLVAYDEHASVLFCERCKQKPDGAAWRVLRSTGAG